MNERMKYEVLYDELFKITIIEIIVSIFSHYFER